MLLPGRGGSGRARLSLEDRVEMSSSDARQLRGDSKKRWGNSDKAEGADLFLLCLEMCAASPSNGEKPQSFVFSFLGFFGTTAEMQWSHNLENVMHMANLGSLLRLRETCTPTGLEDEDCPSAWEKPEGPGSAKSSSHPCSQENNFYKHRLSYTVRLLQFPASPSDEQEREPAAVTATIFSSLFCYWCIYTWFLLTIVRIILTNHKENRPSRIQFVLTKCLRKITLFLSMLNYSSFSLILIKLLRVGIFSKKISFHWQKKATQINEENVYSI